MRSYRRDRCAKNVHLTEDEAAFFSNPHGMDGEKDRSPQDTSGAPLIRPRSLEAINVKLDALHAQCAANETRLKRLFDEWDTMGEAHAPIYWLTLARISELTLLTAGAYADSCEFRAAGDLLANPAKVLIHIKDRREPVCKPRHVALSTALQSDVESGRPFMAWYRANALQQVAQNALLPDLIEAMTASGWIEAPYLDDFKARMGKIADTIAFLSAWQIDDARDTYTRLQNNPDTRCFIEANLCRFCDRHFKALGALIAQAPRGGPLCKRCLYVAGALSA